MSKRCTICGETFDGFLDVVFNSNHDHGPFEHVSESKV